MNIKNLLGFSEFLGLDIGTSAIRLVQLRGGATAKSLVRYASMPIDVKTAQSDAAADQQKLASAVASAVQQSGMSVKDVVAGVPSGKLFATVVDFPKLSADELEKTIRYQMDTHIPMSVDEAKVDWAVLGDSPGGKDQVEVLLAAVSDKFSEARLDVLESIGLNVVAFEPEAIALSRSLLPSGYMGAALMLEIGDATTDLVVAYQGSPRLVRGIPTGASTFVKAAQQNLNIDEKQATQFVYKFGLNEDKLEGQVFKALESTVDGLVSEVQKSMKFFTNRYIGINIEKLVLSGGASALPGFPLYIANKLGVQVEIGNAWLNVSYPQSMHNDLVALSNHFSVAVGLALRGGA